MKIGEMKKRRDYLLVRNEEIFKAVEAEEREGLSEDEQTEIDAHLAEIDELDKKIEARDKMQELRASNQAKLDANDQPVRRDLGLAPEVTNGALPSPQKPEIDFPRYKKLRAFKNPEAAYRCGKWIRAQFMGDNSAAAWCRENGIQERAHGENQNTTGGFLVPEEFISTIIDLREEYGVFRRNTRVIPMGRDTVTIPRRSGGLTHYYVDEAASITESTKSWDQVRLTARKLGVFCKISRELAEDAVIDIAEDLAMEVAWEFAYAEDLAGFLGDGSTTYGGIQGVNFLLQNDLTLAGSVDATAADDTFAEILLTDINVMMSKLPKYARRNAKFYMHQEAYDAILMRLVAAGGGNTIQSMSGGLGMSFLGYPVETSQVFATSSLNEKVVMLFGDLRLASSLGDRRQLEFATSDHFLFQNDQTAVRATQRYDINVHDVGDSTTAGPIVGLLGNTS